MIPDSKRTNDDARYDGAFRGRRLSWQEFYALRPDLRPANDNEKRERKDAETFT
ncbi:hypothetical protein AAAK29_19295 [Mesorhizobium sp. CCNWLW179-1]|uniref:hypothetical protein n=1 Tax=unclassified Mesorhizobium TaxID=325217 RepID=UPI003014A807